MITALKFLKEYNEDYSDIEISQENASEYPEDGILQNVPQIDPKMFRIPDEEPRAANEDSVIDNATTVDIPVPMQTIIENIRSAMEARSATDENEQQTLQWPSRHSKPASEFITGYFSKAFPDSLMDVVTSQSQGSGRILRNVTTFSILSD